MSIVSLCHHKNFKILSSCVLNLQADIYKSVVNDVIEGVKEAFMEDSLDETILQELRQVTPLSVLFPHVCVIFCICCCCRAN